MTDDHSPTLRLRRLGHELRRLREDKGLTIREAAAQLEWSAAKISRIESGHTKRVDVQNIRALCGLYGVTEQGFVETLLALAREAKQRGWWQAYQDIIEGPYVGLESEASTIRTFQLGCIPGLLQTAEYAAAITRAASVRDPEEVERRVGMRMKRQEVLGRAAPPQFWAVIDESAVLRPVGGRETHEAQLRKLIDTYSLDHVKVQILPLAAGEHAGLTGQFVILDFPEITDRSVVYLETATEGLYLEEAPQLKRYNVLFQHVCASALSVEASITHLSNLIDKL
ncbi:helix-turn-helix transcriptional regulator [Sphaerisporangium sp. NPDC051017]|uniref:helix-turn-helix domain-containing protein n=1 Tax=Sphaerisporangium sp. NPDC051017 TaxID=3154636 RepID=UPI003439779D